MPVHVFNMGRQIPGLGDLALFQKEPTTDCENYHRWEANVLAKLHDFSMIALGRRAGHRRCGAHALCSPDTGAMMLRHLISMDDANYEPGYLA